MAEAVETLKVATEEKPEEVQATTDMELEAAHQPHETEEAKGEAANAGAKRVRGEGEEENGAAKKHKAENSVEEERPKEKAEHGDEAKAEEGADGEGKCEGDGEAVVAVEPVKLGPKTFGSSVEMFEYFYKLQHSWAPNLDVNKYEYLVLSELLEKGHPECSKKIGSGVLAFQIRSHPMFKNRCFFILRVDGSSEDFSFRKCVDHIWPLPDEMKASMLSGNGRGQQRGGGRGGRGGGWRGGGRGRRGR